MNILFPHFSTLSESGYPSWLYPSLGVAIGIWVVLGVYVFSEIKEMYAPDGTFSNKLLDLWFVIWGFYIWQSTISSCCTATNIVPTKREQQDGSEYRTRKHHPTLSTMKPIR